MYHIAFHQAKQSIAKTEVYSIHATEGSKHFECSSNQMGNSNKYYTHMRFAQYAIERM